MKTEIAAQKGKKANLKNKPPFYIFCIPIISQPIRILTREKTKNYFYKSSLYKDAT